MSFTCDCGLTLDLIQNPDFLHEHIHACTPMQKMYGQLYSILGIYNQKMQKTDQVFIKNILAMLEAFSTDVRKTFDVQPDLILTQPLVYPNSNIVSKVLPYHTNQNENQKDKEYQFNSVEKVNSKQLQNFTEDSEMSSDPQQFSSSMIKEQQQLWENALKKNQHQNQATCSFCYKQIQSEQNQVFIQSTGCLHNVHTQCLRDHSFKRKKSGLPVQCPVCKLEVSDIELKEILSSEDIQEMEKIQIAKLIELSPNMRQCPCGTFMEISQGEVDYNQKDDMGNIISREAAVHLSHFRVRCQNCQKTFCSECQIQPYHVGVTCEAFQKHKAARKCRFCDCELSSKGQKQQVGGLSDVCQKKDCTDLKSLSCTKRLGCGHVCRGFKDEKKCLPCLAPECAQNMRHLLLADVDQDAFCQICWVSGLGTEPCVQLGCKHVFHLRCIVKIVEKKWVTPRVVFNFLNCPGCKQRITAAHCPQLQQIIVEAEQIEEIVAQKALQRAKHEGLDKDLRLKKLGDPYYNKLKEFALYKCAYYMCFKCKEPYFGGMKDCEQNQLQEEEFKAEELVCSKCASQVGGVAGVTKCQKHGSDHIDFKCRYCCSIALWFCHGNTHYCDPCHRHAGNNKKQECKAHLKNKNKAQCDLGVDHPPSGTEFALGCGLCRSNAVNHKDF